MRTFIVFSIVLFLAVPLFSQESVHKKVAILVGINDYPDKTPPLKGAIEDVKRMDWVLKNTFSFDVESLTNEKATKANILERLKIYSESCKPGDMLLFYFSGYGSMVPDKSGDEEDGLDEILCPYDFQNHWGDPLSDDLFYDLLMKLTDIQVIMILDCSFSLPNINVPQWNPDARVKTLWPLKDGKISPEIMEQISSKKQENRSCLFLDKEILKNHVFLGASRGYTPAFDASLKGGDKGDEITMYHGVFTCCMSANAFPDMTYKDLISYTIVSCQRAKIPQRPVIRCSQSVLDKKIFEFLSR